MVREVIDKGRAIAEVANSYDLVPQTVQTMGQEMEKRPSGVRGYGGGH